MLVEHPLVLASDSSLISAPTWLERLRRLGAQPTGVRADKVERPSSARSSSSVNAIQRVIRRSCDVLTQAARSCVPHA